MCGKLSGQTCRAWKVSALGRRVRDYDFKSIDKTQLRFFEKKIHLDFVVRPTPSILQSLSTYCVRVFCFRIVSTHISEQLEFWSNFAVDSSPNSMRVSNGYILSIWWSKLHAWHNFRAMSVYLSRQEKIAVTLLRMNLKENNNFSTKLKTWENKKHEHFVCHRAKIKNNKGMSVSRHYK